MKTSNKTITMIPCGTAHDHVCKYCRGLGWVNCPQCQGTGKLNGGKGCHWCNEKGTIECPACHGIGSCPD